MIETTPEQTLPLTRPALRTAQRRSIRWAPPCRAPRQPAARSVCTQPHRHQHITFSRACWQRDFFISVLPPVHPKVAKRLNHYLLRSKNKTEAVIAGQTLKIFIYRFLLQIVSVVQKSIISNILLNRALSYPVSCKGSSCVSSILHWVPLI